MFRMLALGTILAVTAVSGVEARSIPNTGTPQSVQQLIACRSIADSAQRLACYDRQSDALSTALAKKEVVVIDKARATAAKKSLFGFSIPNFGGIFGGNEDEVKEIASTVTRVSQDPYGAYVVTLADGSTWYQQDDAPLGLGPEKGDKIVVRRGSFGAFYLSINGQPGIRVKRIG
ncbi:MAG: hypothetical protein ACTHOI_07435 [Sphingomicrobium sp.]